MKSQKKIRWDGNKDLFAAVEKMKLDLLGLVAETSIWVDPKVCVLLKNKTGSVVRYPDVRRKKSGEQRGMGKSGIRLDDNTYANNAIKKAVGATRINMAGYEACHIWPKSCYDERYHTALPNIVLIPSAIASLSDESEEVIKALQYRSYELYQWLPEGKKPPLRPKNYPNNWQSPINIGKVKITDEFAQKEVEADFENDRDGYMDKVKNETLKIVEKLPGWLKKPSQINHAIFINYMRLLGGNNKEYVSRDVLRKSCSSIKTFDTNFTQMSCFGVKNHGKIFDVSGNEIRLWEPVEKFAKNLWNEYLKTHH